MTSVRCSETSSDATTSVKIRRLKKANEPFLWEMLYHALYVSEGHDPFPKEIVTEPEIAKYVLGWGKAGDLGLAVIDEVIEQPVGAVWIRLFTSENRGYGYVDNDIPELSIAILPNYRNRGLGTDLMNRMISEAGRRYPGLSLSVSSDNPAKRLYQRLGFEIIAQHGTSFTMMKRFATSDIPGKEEL